MEGSRLNWIANFIWSLADDVLRDLYVRGKYRDVILPMTVLLLLDSLLGTKVETRSANKRRHPASIVPADRRLIKFGARG